jgi:hypothetical protein
MIGLSLGSEAGALNRVSLGTKSSLGALGGREIARDPVERRKLASDIRYLEK